MFRLFLSAYLILSSTVTMASTVVYDNFADVTGRTFTYFVGMSATSSAPPRSTAMQFSPTSSGFFSSVEVSLLEYNIEPWSLSAELYLDVNGLPALTPLEVINFSGGQPGFNGILSLQASETVFLDTNETYWVGLHPQTPGMHVGWYETGLPTLGPNKAQTLESFNGIWFLVLEDHNQAAFRVSVVTVVPIPPAVILLLSALSYGWLLRGRKKSG